MFKKHYEENYKYLLNRAYRSLKDYQYAEDAVQESYENAFRYQIRFDKDIGSFDAWFQVIFFNCLKKYSKFIKDQGVMFDEEVKQHPSLPDNLLMRYPRMLNTEIDCYNKDVDLLKAHLIFGYGGKEIEALIGVKSNTALKKVNRFKQYILEKYR